MKVLSEAPSFPVPPASSGVIQRFTEKIRSDPSLITSTGFFGRIARQMGLTAQTATASPPPRKPIQPPAASTPAPALPIPPAPSNQELIAAARAAGHKLREAVASADRAMAAPPAPAPAPAKPAAATQTTSALEDEMKARLEAHMPGFNARLNYEWNQCRNEREREDLLNRTTARLKASGFDPAASADTGTPVFSNGTNGSVTLRRREFDRLSPHQKSMHFRSGGKLAD